MHVLHASRSSDSLRADELRSAQKQKQPQIETAAPAVDDGLIRPRRTSLSLGGAASATPISRQKKLQNLVDSSVGDVFFSLHVSDEPEPVYVSEVRQRSANFNFQFFDLSEREAAVSRACALTIRLWARRPRAEDWVFLVDEVIDLRKLSFIGTLRDRRFPPNALVLHLEDGLYSLDFPDRIAEPRQVSHPEATSSYAALMKLANLESSIEDAIETRNDIMAQINRILEDTPADGSAAAQEQVAQAERHVAAQQRANRAAQRRRDQLLESLRARRETMARGRQVQARAAQDIADNREKLEASKLLAEQTARDIRGQRRRICSELSAIFPIAPVPDAPPLSFQICGVPVPNSTYDAATSRAVGGEDVLSAGLGLLALLTRHLQLYLCHPLPYPLFPQGSRSMVRDSISQLRDAPRNNPSSSSLSSSSSSSTASAGRRDFPLYLPRGGSTSGQWRFEYAWFLLNKDIESLCASQGLRVVDIRHSLPNIKYLLYVCSAGTEQVPERKKGGVRGLWQAKLKGRVSSLAGADGGDTDSEGASRRGSVDSELMNQHGEALREAVARENGQVDAAAVAAATATTAATATADIGGLPFEDTKFTLRTKGLRERVA